jgi:steroid delta-isomerase-like uncharacterized protein
MATLDMTSIVREMLEAWNDKDMDRVESYSTPEARMTNPALGAKFTMREYAETWARAFPDGKIQITNLVAQGDCCVAEFIGRGTHTGPLRTPMGEVPATGKRVELPLVEIYRLREGRITEGKVYFDTAALMAQLGISPGATAGQRTSQQPTRT